jgi:Mg2+-importing ATPase
VLDICVAVTVDGKVRPLDDKLRQEIEARFEGWSSQGFRVLAIATRQVELKDRYGREDESGLMLGGFLLFLDPPKPGIAEALKAMATRGIAIKLITGDNRYVAKHLAEQVGLKHGRIVTGADLAHMTTEALTARAARTDLFVEIDPNQKERIIHSLRNSGYIVGYMGDGINDAPALHEADIGISVDSAVDVARDAADMILLKRDLNVLLLGIDQGRKTFANTMKYISITTSANFGNMISMAFASLFLPFLPLLAKQILLNNFLSDLPSLAIASDNVDPDQTERPKRWDIGYISRFMIGFGLVSTLFDFVTFGFLLLVMKTDAATFQTAWFVESLLTELGIVMVIRSRTLFGTTAPSALLGWLTVGTGLLAISIPYLPYADEFGFVPLSPSIMAGLLVITLLYLVASSAMKSVFYRYEDQRPHPKRLIAKHN